MADGAAVDWMYDVASMEAAYAEAAQQTSIDWMWDAASMEVAWSEDPLLASMGSYTDMAIAAAERAKEAALKETNERLSRLEELLAALRSGVTGGLSSVQEYIFQHLLQSDNFIMRGLGVIASSILAGVEWVADQILTGIEFLAAVIMAALDAIAKAFGDVFEFILTGIVDYAGGMISGFIANALGIEEET